MPSIPLYDKNEAYQGPHIVIKDYEVLINNHDIEAGEDFDSCKWDVAISRSMIKTLLTDKN